MLALKILLIFLEVVLSFLLVVVILLQRSKGEGLGLAFGAEMGESIFGARASSALVKITIWLGAIFVVNTVILAAIYTKSTSTSLLSRPPIEQPALPPAGQTVPANPMAAASIPSTPMPATPAPQSTAPQETTPQEASAPVAQ